MQRVGLNMLRKLLYLFIIPCFILASGKLAAQPAGTDTLVAYPASPENTILVGQIVITGNKKTRPGIILRELPFKTGDTYSLDVLVRKMETARKQLMNVALFHTVIVSAKRIQGNVIDIAVDVKERWYIFPLPFFRPVDRNLNQWLVEKGASLDRVNYGIKLSHNNFSGVNDKLRFGITAGYTKQLAASYERPYFDRKMKWGLKFSIAAGKNREVNYNTVDDRQVFLKDENNYLRNFITGNLEFTYRRAIKTRHTFGIGYAREQVSDTITTLNPFYFKPGRATIRFPSLYYTMNYLNLDYNPYPTRGYAAQATIIRNGFRGDALNLWQFQVKGLGAWPLAPKTFFSLVVYGGLKLPFNQPYFTRRFFGYGDVFLQGFEYNVVDGVAGGFMKTTFTREIVQFALHTPPGKRGREPYRVPIRIYGKVYGNTGYVHNPQPGDNSLSNKMLYSGGIGIDIVTFYDVIFKFEWSFNSVGQNGLFFHQKSIF